MSRGNHHTEQSWRKYVIAGWAFVECLFFSGILYGWSSLVFVLKEEGIYADLCSYENQGKVERMEYLSEIETNTTLSNLTVTWLNSTWMNDTLHGVGTNTACRRQDSMLNLCFTVGSSIFCASCVVMGHINYKLGTRVTRIISFVFFVVGSICLACVSKEVPWLIFPGLSCIGIGGLPLLVTNTQVSNLFVKDRSTVVGLLVGGYDMSSVVFLIIKLAHQHGLSRRNMYFILTGLHSMTLISTFLFLPRRFISPVEQENSHELTVEEDRRDSNVLLNSARRRSRRPSLADPQSLSSYLKQPMFITHLAWVCVLQLRFYYFLGNLNVYLNRLLDEDKTLVSHYTNVCFYTMMCGIGTSFLAGVVYDRQKRIFTRGRTKLYRSLMPAVLPLILASILAITMSVLVLFPHRVILYPIFIIMTLFRSFLYAIVTAFISAIFPSKFFAMLYGITIVSAGVLSSLQYALFQWGEAYSNAPLHVDICLLCVTIITLVHPVYMLIASSKEEATAV